MSTKQQHGIPDPSKNHFVLTIGDIGHGKSTFNNALIGEHKNEASDATSGVTQNFQTHSSILPEFKDTAFIDSPGLNDPKLALENWVAKYNNTIGQHGAPRLSLVVLLIQFQARPTQAACVELATLLSCVKKLHAENFAAVFNRCAESYTSAKAIEFFQMAVQTLEESAQQSFFSLTERQVLLIRNVNQKIVDQEAVENEIRPSVVKFVSEKLKEIPTGSLLEQQQMTSSQIIEKTGEFYRDQIVKLNEKIAKQDKSIDDLKKTLEEWQRLRQEETKKNQEQIAKLTEALASANQAQSTVESVKDKVYTSSNGTTGKYTGDMVGGKRNGKGTFTWADGDVYQGDWKDDKKNGIGTYKYKDGSVFEGEWKYDKRNGSGTYTPINGSPFKGNWKDNIKENNLCCIF